MNSPNNSVLIKIRGFWLIRPLQSWICVKRLLIPYNFANLIITVSDLKTQSVGLLEMKLEEIIRGYVALRCLRKSTLIIPPRDQSKSNLHYITRASSTSQTLNLNSILNPMK